MKRTLFFLLAVVLFLEACAPGGNAAPTPDLAQAQNTAVALAMTMAAQTMAALPTSTPQPTETPSSSPTPSPSPTLAPTEPPTPTFTATVAAGSCDKPLSSNPAGIFPKTIVISNQSGGDVILSLWLAPTPFGECGYVGFNLPKGATISTNRLPLGCYSAFAYVTLKDRKYSLSQGGLCFNNTDKWTFIIRPNRILLGPP
jgi:hypothetical protein